MQFIATFYYKFPGILKSAKLSCFTLGGLAVKLSLPLKQRTQEERKQFNHIKLIYLDKIISVTDVKYV